MTRDEALRTLELSPGATRDEIRAAWRDLSKVWHPDRFGHDDGVRAKAEAKLKAINEAYEMLQREGGPAGPSPPREAAAEPAPPHVAARRRAAWAIGLAALAVFILLRRPSPGGLIAAAILLGCAFILALRT